MKTHTYVRLIIREELERMHDATDEIASLKGRIAELVMWRDSQPKGSESRKRYGVAVNK